MSFHSLTHAEAYRAAHSIGTDPAGWADNGDDLDVWDVLITPIARIQDDMLNLTNGQLLIGHTANGYPSKASLTAGANISVTPGAGSITVDLALGAAQVDTTNLTDAARAQYLTAIAELDINGASATIPIGLITNNATIVATSLVYTVASSTGTTRTINIGTDSSAASIYSDVSATSQAQFTKVDITSSLLTAAVTAGDFLICSTSGSIGTTGGKILVCLTIQNN